MSGRSAAGPLKVLLGACLLGPLLLFALVAWLSWRSELDEAGRELMRLAQVGREHAGKVFDGQNQVVDRVNDLALDMDADSIRRSERTVHDALAGIVARLPAVQSILLADDTGHALASASTYPVPQDANLTTRDYYQAVVGGYVGTYVSSLQVGDIFRKPFFGLSRPWLDARGARRGVIDVAVSPLFFQDFYAAVIGASGADAGGRVVTLVRADGQILVRYPPFPGPPPRARPGGGLLRAITAQPEAGTYEDRSIVDAPAPARLFAYQKVQGYPVYVVAGRARAAILADWRQAMLNQLVFGVPATLALFALTWTALARTRREEAALGRERREIALRHQAEDALLKAQRLEAVGQLTGGVAHDFNNLLTVILGAAEMLGRRADDPGRVRLLARQIMLAAKRGGEVTQQLLAFSRRQLVKPERIAVNARLVEFKPLLDRAAREPNRVELDLGTDVGLVRLDPGHFEAAILNLVGNARDAMSDGGRIVIATRDVALTAPLHPELPPGDYVLVSVADTGLGMDEATCARAFEPFFTTKDIGKGTGLGLSQVYGFAKQAGGDARIASVIGQGTTVSLLLPRLADGDAPAPAAAGRAIASERARRGEVVLVVEDEPALLETTGESLRELGYEVRGAPGAAGALERLAEGGIDLLFSDVLMPGGMNGLQLAREARRRRPGLKVLLTSGYSAGLDAQAPVEFALLTKPYDRDQLARALRAALEGT